MWNIYRLVQVDPGVLVLVHAIDGPDDVVEVLFLEGREG